MAYMYFSGGCVGGACSTVNITEIPWNEDFDSAYGDFSGFTFEEFVKEMNDRANFYISYTGFFCSCLADNQSIAISRFRRCGFKFTKPTKNTKNGTTICLGVATIPDVLEKTKAILDARKKK